MKEMAIVVLAGGRSLRMGRDKLFLPIIRGGRKTHCLAHTLEVVESYAATSQWHCHLFCVYSSEETALFLNQKNESVPVWHKILNENPEMGQSSSLLKGLRAVSQIPVDAICFVVADQPNLEKKLFHRLEEGLEAVVKTAEGTYILAQVSVPTYLGEWRNPIMIRSPYFKGLEVLTGDVGAKKAIQQMCLAVSEIEFEAETYFLDMDTPEAYEALKD